MQKGPEKSQVWDKMVIGKGESVLSIEELMTTALTANAVAEGLEIGNPNPITFVPFVPVLVYRPDNEQKESGVVGDRKVVPVISLDIWALPPDECPLCAAGSERLEPKGVNWDTLTGKN